METMKVNPYDMISTIDKIKKSITSYEKQCNQLYAILETNEAELDIETLKALNTSIDMIRQKLSNMKIMIEARNELMKMVAESYRSVNESGTVVANSIDLMNLVQKAVTANTTNHTSGTGGKF